MPEPIRVAHVMGKMVGGGVEAVVMNYYRHIDRSKVQFDFLVDTDSTLVPRSEIESLGGRVFEIPPYQHPVAYQRELIKLFRSEGWLIVHSHVNALSVFPLCAAERAGVPVRIAHSHSTSGKGEHARNAMKAVLRRFSNVYPTYRMACSRYAGEWLFGRKVDFELLYNAIDLSHFIFDPVVRAEARNELGLSDEQLAVGHVGRFMPQKNHGFLIDVFAELARRRDDAVLLLVGDGEGRLAAERKVADLGLEGRVFFLGQRSDVDRLYRAFDVFVLPSLYEGLPLVAVEAQRAGLPCFLADTITREIDVTCGCSFLSIDDVSVWADTLECVASGSRLPVSVSDFTKYNIDGASDRLAKRYLKLVEAC